MKVTKKFLEEQNFMLSEKIKKLETENRYLIEVANNLRGLSIGGMASSIVIAAEKVADAAAHVLADARTLYMKRQ